MSNASKPSLPTDYVRPTVWDPEKNTAASAMGGMNRPSALPRSDVALSRGKHDLQLYSLGTPNGVKVTAFLEELIDQGLLENYDAYTIKIWEGGT